MRKLSLLTVVLLVVVTTIQAQWAQIGADIDGEAADDQSGYSVSLSADGSVLAIGATYNDGNGTEAGQVRVYKNISGTWTQIGADIDGEADYDHSGYSVSLSADGSVLAIGATSNDGNGSNLGHVRVYKNISGTWTQIGADIDGEATKDQFGNSVSLSADGSVLAIGAVENNGNGSDAGHVRVYKNISGIWTKIGNDIDGEAANDYSGVSVSLSADGSVLAIGASGNDGNGSTNSGHVRVYQNLSGTWTKIGADIYGEAAGDNSGSSVSLSDDGSVLAIGATSNYGNGSNSGHVRVYQNISGTWTKIGADIDGEAADDYSGSSVSLSADGLVLAIGADGNNGNGSYAGHVRVYKNNGGAWTQIGDDINGEAADDYSGGSVSLSADGSVLAIGAPDNNGTGTDAGHVRVYGAGSLLTISQPISLNEISIYPNPTSGKLTIENGQLIIKNIEITDITGKTIINYQLSIDNYQFEIDLSGLNNGIYFISIQTDNEIFTSKIIKK
jgi:Flp pilus assembly pilin Flp